MIVRRLQIENFRNLRQVSIEPHPRLNLLHGANGAGKTSVVEALVVLARGRSFRTTQASELIGPEAATFRVFAETENSGGAVHRLGLERSGRRWRGRKDGQELSQLSQLTRSLPLVLLEPDSHLLVSGAPEIRRRFLDWGMFHVEQQFLDTWRRFSKALKQRNAALRREQPAVLDSLDRVLAEQGSALSAYRRAHCDAVAAGIEAMLLELRAGLAEVSIEYQQGWTGDNYADALRRNRQRDIERGLTHAGPHRADLLLSCGNSVARAVLSRGEQKMLAAALLLTQAGLLGAGDEPPVMLLDDLASEFDRFHFENVLARALEGGSQVWVTGTREEQPSGASRVFHVEQGKVRAVV